MSAAPAPVVASAPAGAKAPAVEMSQRLRACTILLVDDEEANLDLLEMLLAGAGYGRVVRTTDAREVLGLVARHVPDLVLLDLHMPHRHGLEVLADLAAATPPGEYRPVLVLTADATWEARERALARGARDFVTKPFEAAEVLLRVENLLEARTLHVEQARLLAAAELATRERERLLAVVAHDLRNPLGAVALYAEMLASLQPEDGDAYARGALATIHQSALGMQRLVEDLLDVASLQGGALRVRRERRPVAPVFDEAERMLRPLADAAGVRLVVAGAGDAAADAEIDGPRLVQLLSNLVGNAVKFTPPGGLVTLRWRVDDDALDVTVSDTGPGIAPEELPHLFAAFRPRERDAGGKAGAGLGLWIARAIAEAHDGTLHLAPSREGATFHLVLPRAAPPARRWED